jgi:hypothetical protein
VVVLQAYIHSYFNGKDRRFVRKTMAIANLYPYTMDGAFRVDIKGRIWVESDPKVYPKCTEHNPKVISM